MERSPGLPNIDTPGFPKERCVARTHEWRTLRLSIDRHTAVVVRSNSRARPFLAWLRGIESKSPRAIKSVCVETPQEAVPRKTSRANRRIRFLVTALPAARPSATIKVGGSPGLVYATHGPYRTRTPAWRIRLNGLLRLFRTTACRVSDGQAMPTLGAAPLQYIAPVGGAHTLPEAVTRFSLTTIWLVCPLHGLSPLQ